MMLLEAYELVGFSEAFEAKLESAFATLSQKQGLADEKAWLTSAIERLRAVRLSFGDVLSRAVRLPELELMREAWAASLQQQAVERVEHLQAGIAFHAGTRSPLLEALYSKLKLPVLRRAHREDFERFCVDFEKKLNSSYAKRMFADASLAMLAPAAEQVKQAFTTWRQAFAPQPLTDDEARALRDELLSLARQLELPLTQARLLVEAALAPVKNAFEELGLATRPRKRARPVEAEERDAVEPPREPEPEPETEVEPEPAASADELEAPQPVETEPVAKAAPRRRGAARA